MSHKVINKHVNRLGVLRRTILKDVDEIILNVGRFDNELTQTLLTYKRVLLSLKLDKPNNIYFYNLEVINIATEYIRKNLKRDVYPHMPICNVYNPRFNFLELSNSFLILLLASNVILYYKESNLKEKLFEKYKSAGLICDLNPKSELVKWIPHLAIYFNKYINIEEKFNITTHIFYKLIKPVIENNDASLPLGNLKNRIRDLIDIEGYHMKFLLKDCQSKYLHCIEQTHNEGTTIHFKNKVMVIHRHSNNSNIFCLEDLHVKTDMDWNFYMGGLRSLVKVYKDNELLDTQLVSVNVLYYQFDEQNITYYYGIDLNHLFYLAKKNGKGKYTIEQCVGVVNSKGKLPNTSLLVKDKDKLLIEDIGYQTFTGVKDTENLEITKLIEE